MTVPNPQKGESQGKYVSRCMKFFDNENSNLPRKQQLAACYDKYREARRKKVKAKVRKSKDLARELRKLIKHFNSKRM